MSAWSGPARLALFMIVFVLAGSALAPLARADSGSASISTDKKFYQPEEVVSISGTGFLPDATVTVTVTRPDDGQDSWDVSTDSSGDFTTTYQLDGLVGTYYVDATDGTNSASTTFADASRTFDQCQDDQNNDDVKDPCEWITGDIHTSISAYTEGDSVAYRVWLDSLVAGSSHTVTIRYDFTKKTSGGIIVLGFDFLTHPDATETATAQRCTDIPGPIGVSTSACGGMSGPSTFGIPSDPFAFATSGINAPLNGQSVASKETASSALKQFVVFGGTLTAISPITKVGNPNMDSSSQSQLSITFTVGTGAGAACSGSGNCKVNVLWGGHLAKGTTDPGGWGAALGASSFPGASISMRLNSIDGDSSGAINRSLQPSAVIPPGTIVVVKDAIPDNSQVFSFSGTDGIGSFNLVDSGTPPNSATFVLVFGTYTVQELGPPSGWQLTGLACSDPSGGTSTNLGTRTATIGLASAETVTCTFTNTNNGNLIIAKRAVGGDDTFSFTTTGGDGLPPSFSIATSSGAGSQTYSVVPGTYGVSEDSKAGWDLTSATCSDGSPVGAIVVSPGESVTCTFENTKRGTIVIVKHAIGGNGEFSFTGDLGSFSITTSSGSGSQTFGNLVPGTYGVSETNPSPAWDLTSATCDDGSTVGAISLQAGETVTCTFTNTKRGTIVIVKQSVGGDDGFGFSGDLGSFSITTSSGSGSATFNNKVPGTYSMSEGDPTPEWDLTDLSCADSDGSGTGSTWNLGTRTATIHLDAGETVTCTFENTKRGTIVIVKHAVGGNGEFSFTGDLGSFSITTASGSGSETFNNVVPGIYGVSETSPVPEWDLTSATCNDGSDTSAISLQPGETVTCTFTNTKRGTVIIEKVTVGGDGSFSFTGDLGGFPVSTTTNFGDKTFNNVVPGTYSVEETDPAPAWDLTGLSCADSDSTGTSSTSSLGTRTTTIRLDAGETVTCTFTNTARSKITVEKVTVGGDSSFEFDPSWEANFFLSNGQSHTSDFLVPGTYSVAEAAKTGWDLTSTTCDDGSAPSAIGLNPGETVTCTFTNTARGTIIIEKETTGGDGEFFFTGDLGSFSITTSSGSGSMTFGDLVPTGVFSQGTYGISETDPTPQWDLTGATCDDGSDPSAVSLQAGETVTCTFENTARGKLIVDKVTIPAGDSASFSFTVTGPNGYSDTFGLTDAAPPHSSGFIKPGTYTAVESSLTGWDLTGATCDDGSAPTSVGIGPGEIVTCTFTNTKRGHIVVDKVTQPSGSSVSFDFNLAGGSPFLSQGFSLTDAATPHDSGAIRPGSYAVTESSPTGWDLRSATCDDGSSPYAITLDPGETVTCTFTNAKRAEIIVHKITYGGNGNFGFTLSGVTGGTPSPTSLGTTITTTGSPGFGAHTFGSLIATGVLTQGTYGLSETAPTGWTLMSASCSDGSPVGAIDLSPGESVICTFSNILKSLVTDSALCTFDRDTSLTGQQFRLLFTQDPLSPATYKVTSTNPGQFYYNMFFTGSGSVSVTIMTPYPFVTQGANPIHAYDGAIVSTVSGQQCITPGNEIYHSSQPITLSSYGGKFGSFATVTVPFTWTGFVYLNIHLDYGLKGSAGWSKGGTGNDGVGSGGYAGVTIMDLGTYTFSFTDGVSDSSSIQNQNAFKRDPGFGGQVTNSYANGVSGVVVKIYKPDGSLLGTTTTDTDGFYVYQYKYTGSPSYFRVSLQPTYDQSKYVLVKANSFVWVDFQV